MAHAQNIFSVDQIINPTKSMFLLPKAKFCGHKGPGSYLHFKRKHDKAYYWPKPIRATKNKLYLKMVTDSYIEKKGFIATWEQGQ